MKQTRTKQIEN